MNKFIITLMLVNAPIFSYAAGNPFDTEEESTHCVIEEVKESDCQKEGFTLTIPFQQLIFKNGAKVNSEIKMTYKSAEELNINCLSFVDSLNSDLCTEDELSE